MADVAAAAGVSRATVSRVLTGDPAVVESTAAAVREVIDRLGYRPNRAAQALMGASRTLGMVFGEPPERASARLLAAVQEAATEAGYGLTVAIAADHGGEQLRRGLDSMVDQRVAAVVVIPGTELNAEILASTPLPFPVVSTTDLGPDAFCSIAALDELGAVVTVVRHLQETGRRRILHIGGRHETIVSRFRREGWESAVELPDLFEPAGSWTPRAGYEALHRAVAAGMAPDAVFAASDDIALGVLRAAVDLGLHVPDQLAVAGIGGLPSTEFYGPGLTTTVTDLHARGAAAVAESVRRLREPDSAPVRRLLPAELVVRGSTDSSAPAPQPLGLDADAIARLR